VGETRIISAECSSTSGKKIGSRIGGNGWAGYAVLTAVNGGSELLIFVLRGVHSRR